MDEPIVTAAAPPPHARNLAQQETDFTSEGSPPPGVVGPIASLPAAARDLAREKQVHDKAEALAACNAAPAHGTRHRADSAKTPQRR